MSPFPSDVDGSLEFAPIILDPALRWRARPFDLRFDAHWTHQEGCEVSMNADEQLFLTVIDRDATPLSGMRFSTGADWISASLGQRVRLSFTTMSSTPGGLPFRAAYLPQDSDHSGFFRTVANPAESTFSFEFSMPATSEVPTHLIVVEPLIDDAELVISAASLEIVSA